MFGDPAKMQLRLRRSLTSVVVVGVAASGVVAVAPQAQAARESVVVRSAVQPVLRFGMSDTAVRTVQARLGVRVTGYFGPLTLAAVKRFQRKHGIPTTGVVATLTWGKLNQLANPAAKPASKPAPSSAARPTLRKGMRHNRVVSLQRSLKMPMVTGYFGSLTESYVKALQRAARLPATGVVDGRTWNKVGRVAFPRPGSSSGSTPAPSGSRADRVLAIAKSLRGIPYVANGYSPAQGFNCSSFTQYVYERIGVNLGGAYTVTQYAKSRHISRAQARPGDLVFYYNYPNNFLGHVGIYAGGGKFWHAPRTGRVVSLDSIYSNKVLFARVL